MKRLALMKTRWWVVVPLVVLFAASMNLWQSHRERQKQHVLAGRVTALKDNLFSMRKALDNFRADHGRHPARLEELVPKYLRRIPADPMTGEVSWRLITEERVETSRDFTSDTAAKSESVIVDVRSLAPGSDPSGRPYSEY